MAALSPHISRPKCHVSPRSSRAADDDLSDGSDLSTEDESIALGVAKKMRRASPEVEEIAREQASHDAAARALKYDAFFAGTAPADGGDAGTAVRVGRAHMRQLRRYQKARADVLQALDLLALPTRGAEQRADAAELARRTRERLIAQAAALAPLRALSAPAPRRWLDLVAKAAAKARARLTAARGAAARGAAALASAPAIAQHIEVISAKHGAAPAAAQQLRCELVLAAAQSVHVDAPDASTAAEETAAHRFERLWARFVDRERGGSGARTAGAAARAQAAPPLRCEIEVRELVLTCDGAAADGARAPARELKAVEAELSHAAWEPLVVRSPRVFCFVALRAASARPFAVVEIRYVWRRRGAAEPPKPTALPQFAMSPVPAEEMDVGFAVDLPTHGSIDDAVLQLQVVVE